MAITGNKMLRTQQMRKIRIIALGKDRERIVAAAHRIGVIDLRKSILPLPDDIPPESGAALSDMLVRIEGCLGILEKREIKGEAHLPPGILARKVAALSEAIDSIYALSTRRKQMLEEGKALDYAEHVASAFSSIDIDFSSLGSGRISIRGFETERKSAAALQAELKKSAKRYEVIVLPFKKDMAAVLLASERSEATVDEIVKKHKMKELDMNARYLDGKPGSVISVISLKRKENEQKEKGIAAQISEMSEKYYSTLANLREMLKIEIERAGISSMFRKTVSTFVMEGWVPDRRFREFRDVVDRETAGRYFIDSLEAKGELAPTLVKRPKILKPFDYMVEFISIPRSDEIDPTWIFILSFPIFYGLMVSDVGYGVASLVFATFIKRKVNPEGLVANTASIWQLSSISAIFFGFVSNQYLGLQLNQYFTTFHGFDWFTNISGVLVATLLFGVVQILLGLFFGFINHYEKGHMKKALSKLTGMLLIIAGCVGVAGGLFNAFPVQVWEPAAGIAVLSMLVTMALSGAEAGEVPNLMSHILSYTRIMGFGLASVILAFLIDSAFTPKLSDGPLLFIVYLVIFLVLHFLNMLTGIFEGIVQGIRLNVVEFFGKFYEGGGIKYRPFSYRRVYTKE